MRHLARQEETKPRNGTQRGYAGPKLVDFCLILGLSLLGAVIFNWFNPNRVSLFPHVVLDETVAVISPASAMARYQRGEMIFVDAMPTAFYDREHIPHAVNMPMNIFDIMYMMALSEEDKRREIIVYGRTVSKPYDEELANKLASCGHENVRILEGGLTAWKNQGYPVEP